MPTKKIKEDNICIKSLLQITENFTNNIKLIRLFATTLNPLLETMKDKEELIKKIMLSKGIDVDKFRVVEKDKLTPEEQKIIEQYKSIGKHLAPRIPMLIESSFLLLISYLEILFKDLLKLYYFNHLDALRTQEKDIKITVDEINLASNLNELKAFIIENYVDSIIYDNFDKQLKKIYDSLNIQLNSNIDTELIKEATKRRNLLIHNEGKVNQRYNRETGKKEKIGAKLLISIQYFNTVYYEIYLLGLILLSFACRNLKDSKSYEYIIEEEIFTLLKKEKYDYVIRFYNTCKDIDFIDTSDNIILKIDYLIALKYKKNKDLFKKELSKVKVAHMEYLYKTAFAVLKDNKKDFLKYLPKTKISKDAWNEWPLFKEFREDKELYKKIEKTLIKNQKRIDKEQKKNDKK